MQYFSLFLFLFFFIFINTNCHLSPEVNADILHQLINSNQLNINRLNESSGKIFRYTENQLMAMGKAQFQTAFFDVYELKRTPGSLLNQVNDWERRVGLFFQRKPTDFPNFVAELQIAQQQIKQKSIKIYSEILDKHGIMLGLKQEEISLRKENITARLVYPEIRLYATDSLQQQFQVSQIKLNLVTLRFDLLTDLLEYFAGGRTICGYMPVPIIQPLKNSYKKGENFTAKIFGGFLYPPTEIEDQYIFVDGKKMPMGEDGTVVYTQKINTTDSIKINVGYRYRNILTGEVYEQSSNFTYGIQSN